jgi:hypothetical protein
VADFRFGRPISLIRLFLRESASLGSFSDTLCDVLFHLGKGDLGLDQYLGLWPFAQRLTCAAYMPLVSSVSSESTAHHFFQPPTLAPSPNPFTPATSFPCCLPTLLLLAHNLILLAHSRKHLAQILSYPSSSHYSENPHHCLLLSIHSCFSLHMLKRFDQNAFEEVFRNCC